MGTQAQAPSAEKAGPCIARQPILTNDEDVFGYEWFFRQSSEEQRFTSDADSATSALIDTLSVIGFDVLCDGRLDYFINKTYNEAMRWAHEITFATKPHPPQKT